MKPFAFRQRVGNLNWKAISSVDLEAIIDDNQIEELQSIIDEVIFSEIKNQDIKGTSISELKKLIQIMQLMLEYLLYCQESQLQLVHQLHQKNKKLKKLNQEVMQEHESAKEDIRIYKRQLNLLKTSIEKYKQMVLKNDGYVAVAPRVFNPLSPDQENKEDKQQSHGESNQLGTLVESMLRHERQTRDFVKDILDEQRGSLLREFDRMASRSDNDRMNSLTFEQQLNSYVDRITQKIERIAVTAANTALQSLPQPQPLSGEKNEMEFRMMEVATRERRVVERERELQDQLYDLEMRIKSFEKQVAIQNSRQDHRLPSTPMPQIRSIGINTVPLEVSSLPLEDVYRKGIILASHILARKTGPDRLFFSLSVFRPLSPL
jgi:myosin heavy subunit